MCVNPYINNEGLRLARQLVRDTAPAEPGSKGATMDDSEQGIETYLQAKGLTAPRLMPSDIDNQIIAEDYHVFPGTTLTVCCLTLCNGFQVTGTSAAASPENFDQQAGRTISRRNAREKIWELEGYRLKTHLYRKKLIAEADASGAIDTHRARLREEGAARLATDGGPSIEGIRGAVARGWCADGNRDKEMDSDLAEAIAQEVLKII